MRSLTLQVIELRFFGLRLGTSLHLRREGWRARISRLFTHTQRRRSAASSLHQWARWHAVWWKLALYQSRSYITVPDRTVRPKSRGERVAASPGMWCPLRTSQLHPHARHLSLKPQHNANRSSAPNIAANTYGVWDRKPHHVNLLVLLSYLKSVNRHLSHSKSLRNL